MVRGLVNLVCGVVLLVTVVVVGCAGWLVQAIGWRTADDWCRRQFEQLQAALDRFC